MPFQEQTNLLPWFEKLADVCEAGILLVNRGGELEHASPRVREMLWCQDEQQVRAAWETLRRQLAELMHPAAAGQREKVRALSLDVQLGERLHQLLAEVHLIEAQACEGYLVLLKDRKELESLETDLRQAAQFRSKGRLYRAMAHDLRQPLAAISLYLQLVETNMLQSALPEPERQKQIEYVGIVRGEVAQLDRSLMFLLSETGPGNGEQTEFELIELVEELQRLITPQARKQGVQVHVSLPEAPAKLCGYRDRLKQAILNILVNALEAMPQGGELTLCVQVQPQEAVVSVRDTGGGIAPEHLGRLFTLHFTTRTTGTGIGLYVARQIVRGAGGDIAVQTQFGQGTEFQIRLPLNA